MPRAPIWGSASRSRRPLAAPPASRGLRRVGGAALAAAVAALVVHFGGGPSPLSPGPLAAAHVAATPRCADCHGAEGIEAGCVRCHAAGAGERFAATAHTANGPERCATCHGEHRGPAATAVADASCASCHFASLAAHPAPLPRQRDPRERGLAFSHAFHLGVLRRESDRDGDVACATCHGPRQRLARPTFARCAGCHAPEGTLGAVSVARAEVALPQDLEAAGLELATATTVEQDGASVFAMLGHRDPWLLLNLERAVARGAAPVAGALAGPCVRCHPGAPHGVFGSGAARRFFRARFDHARHAAGCASCHADATTSPSLPLPPPNPGSCLSCHREAAATIRDCAACHRYHPPGLP